MKDTCSRRSRHEPCCSEADATQFITFPHFLACKSFYRCPRVYLSLQLQAPWCGYLAVLSLNPLSILDMISYERKLSVTMSIASDSCPSVRGGSNGTSFLLSTRTISIVQAIQHDTQDCKPTTAAPGLCLLR